MPVTSESLQISGGLSHADAVMTHESKQKVGQQRLRVMLDHSYIASAIALCIGDLKRRQDRTVRTGGPADQEES